MKHLVSNFLGITACRCNSETGTHLSARLLCAAGMAESKSSTRESCSQRVLSAVVFVLLVLVLAAVLQTYRRLTRGHGEVVTASEAVQVGLHTTPRPLEPDPYQPYTVASDEPLAVPLRSHRSHEEHKEPSEPSAKEHAKHARIPRMSAEDALKAEREARENVKFGYGSVMKAYSKLKHLVAKDPHLKDCKSPRLKVLGKCTCPAGSKWDPDEETCLADAGQTFFYMYRAQSDHNYPMSNVDMADLAGLMYYLHHEIVKTNATPGVRMNGITRILRWLVTVRPSQEVEEQDLKFMPFVAFDLGRCSVPGCNRLWDHYGFAVGCQRLARGKDLKYSYTSPNNPFGVWYSLPGPCPALRVGEKAGRIRLSFFVGFGLLFGVILGLGSSPPNKFGQG